MDHSHTPVLARLPRGRHGLPQEFVDRNHRNRLLAGTIEAVAARGYAAMTVADITRHAGVSRGAFYRHFADKEDCFLAAYDVVVEWLFETVGAALEPDCDWRQGLAVAVRRTLELLAADPRLARLCAVEVFAAGPAAVERHEALAERLGELLRRGRLEGPFGAGLPYELEEGLLGGGVALVARYVNDGRATGIEGLAPGLTRFLLAPYVPLEPVE